MSSVKDGYGDADEVSVAAMTTTPGFLGSLSSRDEKMDVYHGRISRNRGSREKERERRRIDKEKSQKIHFMNHP